ncbi:MAG: NADH-quinone oxidoreductase subunit C [Candidatus Omnitrophica bacterium]|nr:NADH-quinone oxidoreductase subunit C [Candidatus Omnitrophota bacterium]
MDYKAVLKELNEKLGVETKTVFLREDEIYLKVNLNDFKTTCLTLHKVLLAPIASLFALDCRKDSGVFEIYCSFASAKCKKWFFVVAEISGDDPKFNSLAKDIYSASLFEREIKEMFGIEPYGNPDTRRLRLHSEICPEIYPLRKDFNKPPARGKAEDYVFNKVEGEGIFEVPVGPVHAGIIGPGHFRFSMAGEPIINLEIRLGFKHRGIEKLFEGKTIPEAINLSECVSGDASFANSLSFCTAIEKIAGITPSENTQMLRAVFLELERLYNHINDMGGIAVDVGFSFPAAFAQIVKENILQLNEKLTGSRYLKNVNSPGEVKITWDKEKAEAAQEALKKIYKDFKEIKEILLSSVSFMDRVDGTGVLKKKTAEDLGVTGVAARASGIAADLRKDFPGIYAKAKFNPVKQEAGDCLARLNMRIAEFEESLRVICDFLGKITPQPQMASNYNIKEGFALGYAEAWRGALTYWVKVNKNGVIERCKITDPSFLNWQALSFCVLGDIIPDFPLCNKSFDLSYSGNDL